MGTLNAIYSPHLPTFTSQRNTATTLRTSTVSSLIVSPEARIESTFLGTRKDRKTLKKLPSFPPNSRSNSTTNICKCQVQDFAPIASAGYAVLLLGGGLFAYNKSGSKGSLFGGLTGGALMSVAYYLMQSPETKEIGDALAFGASLLFACVFAIRFASTRKVMPAGLLLVISISLTALTYSAYMQDRII